MPSDENALIAADGEAEEQQIDPTEDDAINGIPVVPRDLLEKLPPELKQQITFFLSQQRIGLPSNPLASKVTSAHIDKILENSDKDSDREFASEKSSKRYIFATFIIALVFIGFLVVYLPRIDKELLDLLVKILLGFVGGFGTGFGASKLRKREE